MEHFEYRKYVRMTDRDLGELYQQLERAGITEPDTHEQRDGARWPYQQKEITILVEQPGGGITGFIGVARNISTGGISVFHGGFVHEGSICHVVLKGLDGSEALVDGAVVSCRHLQRTVHEIGIAFESPINLSDYITQVNERQHEIA